LTIKIAAVSDDGISISQHFGRAQFYVVLTIEDGKITGREQRDKLGHTHLAGEHHEHGHVSNAVHGFSPAEQGRHSRMLEAIKDCQILLARGMGSGAYYSVQQAGIRPMITTVAGIEEAALEADKGTLEDHPEKLH
jgi:predicted Fe-Mo cluster-binding NifX family protein